MPDFSYRRPWAVVFDWSEAVHSVAIGNTICNRGMVSSPISATRDIGPKLRTPTAPTLAPVAINSAWALFRESKASAIHELKRPFVSQNDSL